MTTIAVSIPVGDSSEVSSALERADGAAKTGASLIEWRIDALAEADPTDAARTIARLVRDAPTPSIVTCRPVWEGGQYGGDEADRIALIQAVAELPDPPRYIDIELQAWQRDPAWREALTGLLEPPDDTPAAPPHESPDAAHDANESHDSGSAGVGTRPRLMLSSHDFDQRPMDLLRRVEAMAREPLCAVIKVAWRARSLRDNLQAFDLLSERHKPAIALCMGSFGRMSRILAGKFGAFLTYAAADPDAATAPGQLTVDELVERYRFPAISRSTRVYGVIGWPVEHSLGPALHNAGFEHVGHDGVYLHLPIPAEYEHFKATVGELIDHPRLDFRGASVTIPHKSHLLRFVTECGGRVDHRAERIGAANTLIVGSAGAVSCANTDAPAIVDSLCDALDCSPTDLAELRVTILGAGGVARAAVVALAECRAAVTILNRTASNARQLADAFNDQPIDGGATMRVNADDPSTWRSADCDVIINATSIGMAGGPNAEGSPLAAVIGRAVELDDRHTVFDTVYTPVRTPLLVDAEARGARIITGADLFLRQAALQCERWIGRPAPMDVFRRTLAASLDDV